MTLPTLSDVAVVIPAYNEANTIAFLLQDITKLGVAAIIIVDDGSSDATSRCIRELALPKSHLITLSSNQGKEAAIKAGFQHCLKLPKIAKIITLDGDGQHDPKHIPEIARMLGVTEMVACRREGNMPLTRTFANAAVRLIYRSITFLQVSDIQCGYRGYRRNVVEKIAATLEGKHRFLADHHCLLHGLPATISEIRIESKYDMPRKSHIKTKDILQLSFGSLKTAWKIRRKTMSISQ